MDELFPTILVQRISVLLFKDNRSRSVVRQFVHESHHLRLSVVAFPTRVSPSRSLSALVVFRRSHRRRLVSDPRRRNNQRRRLLALHRRRRRTTVGRDTQLVPARRQPGHGSHVDRRRGRRRNSAVSLRRPATTTSPASVVRTAARMLPVPSDRRRTSRTRDRLLRQRVDGRGHVDDVIVVRGEPNVSDGASR